MPRSVRVQYAGGVYHVMCRGDRKEHIFLDERDRAIFLETLGEVCARSGFRVHAYVLMPNHYHLLIETPEPNLVDGMRWLQGTYTTRFNRRHQLCGHLFQGRYKAVPIDAEDARYFRTVSDYIHLNPIRSNLLKGDATPLADYRWSSYPAFVAKSRLPEWLERQRSFGAIGLSGQGYVDRARYRAYMEKRALEVRAKKLSDEQEEAWRNIRRGWYVGGESFRSRIEDLADGAMKGKQRGSYRSEGARLHDERAAAQRLEEACQRLGVPVEELAARRQNDPVKQAVAWWVKRGTVVSDAWICARLRMGNRVNVSRAVKACRDARDPERKKLLKKMYII